MVIIKASGGIIFAANVNDSMTFFETRRISCTYE